jgi:L-ascorbate metabolism protein UlaG (beta-lactamase superfamily)
MFGIHHSARPRHRQSRKPSSALVLIALFTTLFVGACAHTDGLKLPDGNAPTEVRMTYFGISNWTFQIGALNIMMDGYMTRIPQDYFFGGGGGLKETKAAWPIDKAAVDKINTTLATAPGQTINLILTGHSHFDHSFDTPYWAKLTGAPVIGSQSTCYQVQAQGVPASQCTVINGGETIKLNDYVTMRVVLWNHSGTHATNPEQHDPVELTAIPKTDAKGNLRGGVAEDFPNGGGNRGFLFTVKTASGKPLNFFVTNSGGAVDLDADTLVNGTINRGSPLNSLRKQVADAGLSSVDLWIGAGGTPVAALTVPIVHPMVVMPNHLGNFFFPFASGLVPQFNDPALVDYLNQQKISLVKPTQYLDAFVLDANGVRPVENAAMKAKYGF